MRHILNSQDFDRYELQKLFFETDELGQMLMAPAGKKDLAHMLVGKVANVFFYQPSTRTANSFCMAATHLGMSVTKTDNADKFSSAAKGETLEDTIRVLCEYDPSVIVLRHGDDTSAHRAAAIVEEHGYKVSIVNGGSGTKSHPTQALLDLYTIKKEVGQLENLDVVLGGDLLNGRTGKSLVYLLAKYPGMKFTFVSPPNLKMASDVTGHLREHGYSFTETEDMVGAMQTADIIYWTRVQTESGSSSDMDLSITPQHLAIMKPKAVIMHPLPRVGEIAKAVDADPRAAYFRQARNGMIVRMALLRQLCSQ